MGLGMDSDLPLDGIPVAVRPGPGQPGVALYPAAGADLEAARAAVRDQLPELCQAAMGFALAGGRNAGAYVKFLADLFRLNQASLNVQILIAERLGVPLEDAKRAVDAVSQVPETLEGIEAMNCKFLAWVVQQHPERAEGIRGAIFGRVAGA